jgi:drug/metabolite transporter (DMT)-like permease
MSQVSLATATTVLAEIALALHPILIKQVPTGLATQILARLGTYTALGAVVAEPSERALTWGSWSSASKSIATGLMNLVHIGSSYLSYQHLPAGSALAVFYLYPFMNILAGVLFLGDTFKATLLPLFALAFVGVLLIARFTKAGQGSNGDDKKKNIPLGIGAGLVSAFTETLIFLVAKTSEEPSPWLPILRLYPGALIGLLAITTASGTKFDWSLSSWLPLLLFNIFIGFLGYSLRFWSIPRLPTAIFSILTFIGVAAGYVWGLLFAKEIPSVGALVGAGCITGALGFLRTLEKN